MTRDHVRDGDAVRQVVDGDWSCPAAGLPLSRAPAMAMTSRPDMPGGDEQHRWRYGDAERREHARGGRGQTGGGERGWEATAAAAGEREPADERTEGGGVDRSAGEEQSSVQRGGGALGCAGRSGQARPIDADVAGDAPAAAPAAVVAAGRVRDWAPASRARLAAVAVKRDGAVSLLPDRAASDRRPDGA
jgi:hypothetical protein